MRPLEAAYRFENFFSPLLNDSDFEAKPMVLLLGQYSVGKTSFIKFLLERDFPGSRIGPEPTTDRFVAVMHGPDERIVPGNALAVQADKPFRALQRYGMAFLNKFEASVCPAPILEKITFVDTPGVLSGEKQRIGRTYDFPEVIEWFAERADRILLLFDAHKVLCARKYSLRFYSRMCVSYVFVFPFHHALVLMFRLCVWLNCVYGACIIVFFSSHHSWIFQMSLNASLKHCEAMMTKFAWC